MIPVLHLLIFYSLFHPNRRMLNNNQHVKAFVIIFSLSLQDLFLSFLQSNISLILHAVGEYELSLRFLEKALALNIRYYGAKSLKVAVSFHLVARTQSCMGDFRSALNNEKETYAIYRQQVSNESSLLLRMNITNLYALP